MLGDISIADNIYIVTGYTDMRKSIDGLCAIILKQLQTEPDRNAIYLFCGKRCDRIKVLLREPDGYVLLYKRLDVVHGKYRWPRNSSEVKPITWQQFDWLMSFPPLLCILFIAKQGAEAWQKAVKISSFQSLRI